MISKTKIKFDFATIASHQLRTPLSAMKWFLEMLLEGNAGRLTRRQQDFVTEIYKSNERMIRLVNDLLLVSKIANGQLKLVCRQFIMEKTIGAVVRELTPLTNAASITVVRKFDEHAATQVFGDEDKIRQVLRTLLDNAIRYMVDGGIIIIYCEREHGKLRFEIQDSGVGIPVREKSKIFQQFFRGSNIVRMRTEGTGLGLYIAKAIIQASGGKISFESTEGKGSKFIVMLPLHCGIVRNAKVKNQKSK